MSDNWYKDPKTGEIYQDRKEKGKTVRYVRESRRESSSNKGEASSSRRDQASHRARRDSVISSTSLEAATDRSQAQRGISSRRDAPIREEGSGREDGGSQVAYASYDQTQGRQQEPSSSYGDVYTHGTSRDARKIYHQPGGYNTSLENGAESITDEIRRLDISSGDHYTHHSIPMPIPAETGYTVSQAYSTAPLDPTSTDYTQPYTTPIPVPTQQPIPPSRYVAGTPGDVEKLDKSYQVRNHDYKKFFKTGRVFSTLWTESLGNNVNNVDPTFVSEILMREKVFSKVRRFVVVREGDRAATCLPVTSYDGAGHKKYGINLKDHGYIHSKNPPKKVEGMLSKSLKVTLSRGAAHIKDPSLVNYGKVYTVEANVKVKDIGDLDADSKELLIRYFRRVFMEQSDPHHGVDDTPRQSSAILAHVGGAVSGQPLPSTSAYATALATASYPPTFQYSQAIGQDMTSGNPSSTYAAHNRSAYSSTPDNQRSTYDLGPYQSASAGTGYPAPTLPIPQMRGSGSGNYQPIATGPAYQQPSMNSGYPSQPGYGSVAGAGSGYNMAPVYYSSPSSYPSSDNQYSSMTSGPTTARYAISYTETPRTAASVPYQSAQPGNYYPQLSGGQGPGSSSYASGETNAGYPTSYQDSAVVADEDIDLPTLEAAQQEHRKRRESRTGTSGSDRRRRR